MDFLSYRACACADLERFYCNLKPDVSPDSNNDIFWGKGLLEIFCLLCAHVEFWSVTAAGREEKPQVGGWVGGEAQSGGAIGAGKADKTVSVETAGYLLSGFSLADQRFGFHFII